MGGGCPPQPPRFFLAVQACFKADGSLPFVLSHAGIYSICSLLTADAIPNAFLLRRYLSGIWGKHTHSKPLFPFEVPYGGSWGFFAEQTHSKHFSSSKLAIGHLGAFAQSRRIKNAFSKFPIGHLGAFFRTADTFKNAFVLGSSLLGILGPFAQQTHSKRVPSSKFPLGHLGAFAQSRHI